MKISRFIYLSLLISLIANANVFASSSCDSIKSQTLEIQKAQYELIEDGEKLGQLREKFDQAMAKMVLLDGIRTLKDNYKKFLSKAKSHEDDLDDYQETLSEGLEAINRLNFVEDFFAEIETVESIEFNRNARNQEQALERLCSTNTTLSLCKSWKDAGRREKELVVAAFSGLKRACQGVRGVSTCAAKKRQIQIQLNEGIPDRFLRDQQLQSARQVHSEILNAREDQVEIARAYQQFSECKKKTPNSQQCYQVFESEKMKSSLADLDKYVGEGNAKINPQSLAASAIRAEALGIEDHINDLNKKNEDAIEKVRQAMHYADIRNALKNNSEYPEPPTEDDLEEFYDKVKYYGSCPNTNGDQIYQCLRKILKYSEILDNDYKVAREKVKELQNKIEKIEESKTYKDLNIAKANLIQSGLAHCRGQEIKYRHCGTVKTGWFTSSENALQVLVDETGNILAELDKSFEAPVRRRMGRRTVQRKPSKKALRRKREKSCENKVVQESASEYCEDILTAKKRREFEEDRIITEDRLGNRVVLGKSTSWGSAFGQAFNNVLSRSAGDIYGIMQMKAESDYLEAYAYQYKTYLTYQDEIDRFYWDRYHNSDNYNLFGPYYGYPGGVVNGWGYNPVLTDTFQYPPASDLFSNGIPTAAQN